MASRLAKVAVKPGLGRHLRLGHPWVYRRALAEFPKLPPGAVIDLVDEGKFAARGYFDPYSAIAARVLTTDPSESIDQAFYDRRIQRAFDIRTRFVDRSQTDAFRLVHGEADFLPGVVVDLYGAWAVVKLYSAGLAAHRAMILEALWKQIPHLQGIVGRDSPVRDDEDQRTENSSATILGGKAAPRPLHILENGARFAVDLQGGQKTGFFLDQRENRALVRQWATGRRVLNCFCYSGGFSVNAGLGGALQIFSVDQDEAAIALARENFSLNGLEPAAHDFLAADVFKLLESLRQEKRTFDLVMLDPPAFAKNQKAVEAAVAGYASLNRQALALVAPGGLLFTASCSARVSAEAFEMAVREGARNASAEVTVLAQRFQPPDHPIRLEFPEGRYLKLLVLQKER